MRASRSQPSADAGPYPRSPIYCDLCGQPTEDHPEARKASGLDICNTCIEETLHASAFHARSEMGLVGSGGGRP